MKTITLQGEFQKFINLNQATSRFDVDRLPYEVETRVYVIEINNSDISELTLTNDEFMTLAEEDGRVYSLKGFQEAFNLEEVNTAIDVIRFINVPLN